MRKTCLATHEFARRPTQPPISKSRRKALIIILTKRALSVLDAPKFIGHRLARRCFQHTEKCPEKSEQEYNAYTADTAMDL